ncbi:hypothetical protein ABJI51_04020 [Amycolatopsis sp. NEAU-NG30]|uniref:Uncharacterized protein n=1 Tax=Amycolatopsis melonis TaxID=3156488 RepID=A0ABV0L7D6_9PSEU
MASTAGNTDRVSFDGLEQLLAHATIGWAADRVRAAVRTADRSGRRLAVGLFAPGHGSRREGFPEAPDTAESYRMRTGDDGEVVQVAVSGSDIRGLAYALTELAERITAARAVEAAGAGEEEQRPSVPVRSIQRAFSGTHEDLPWFHDRAFWTEYLDFLAGQRFNRFHLALGMQYNYGAGLTSSDATDNYLCFPYSFLLEVDGFPVRAQGVTEAERSRNLASLAFIARETRRRGMEFQLGLWNHAADYGLGARHSHPILGLGPESHAGYCAAALRELLAAIPQIDGLTFRVHYEGGIPEPERLAFWDGMFRVVSEAGRPMRVDLHAKGLDADLLAAVRKPNIRPVASAKYWAEHLGLPYHQASIRPFERMTVSRSRLGEERARLMGVTELSRRFTRYGYADFLDEDREIDVLFRMWPGTQRLLLWGDPVFAAGYGRHATLGGALGVEFCEPLFFKGRKGSGRPGGRDPYVRDDLRLGVGDWRKYRYTYLLWGRLLYDPETRPEVWRRFLRGEHGEPAADVEALLAPLSRILPLVTVTHAPSAANNAYWPEVYADLPITPWVRSRHYAFDTLSNDWQGVSSFDPVLFYGVGEYADDAVAGRLSGKYTPLEVAAWLDRLAGDGATALERVRRQAAPGAPQTQRVLVDAEILVRLGRFFAGKFRAAVAYALWRRTQVRDHLAEAVELLERAHEAYAGIVPVAAGVYRDEFTFGCSLSERGHWAGNLGAMADDLHALRVELDRAAAGAEPVPVASRRTRPVLGGVRLVVADRFERAAPFEVALAGPPEEMGEITEVTLHHRHLDQSRDWVQLPMSRTGDRFTAVLPAEFTATSYPITVFAEVHLAGADPVLVPGFGADLADSPYLVVHSTAWKAGGTTG